MKAFWGLLCGVFLGAFVFELVRRKSPKKLAEIEKKAKHFASQVSESFSEGYAKDQ